jgi:hypothetical protein
LTDQSNAQCQVDLCCSNNHQSSIRTGYLAFSIDTVRLRAYVSPLLTPCGRRFKRMF